MVVVTRTLYRNRPRGRMAEKELQFTDHQIYLKGKSPPLWAPALCPHPSQFFSSPRAILPTYLSCVRAREPLWLVIPSEILNVIVQMLLYGLDYLHNECHVIHTGNNFTALIFMKNALTFCRPKTW